MTSTTPTNVLICFTGSVATVKIPQIVMNLLSIDTASTSPSTSTSATMTTTTTPASKYSIKLVATKTGRQFLEASKRYHPESYSKLKPLLDDGTVPLYNDEDEWRDLAETYLVGRDPVLHIELRKWADVILVAPLSANTLAKIANGLCDNLLTSVIRACDRTKRIVLAPAMNTMMWENPLTARQLASLPSHFYVVPPVSKTLACNDVGVGAMASVEEIVRAVEKARDETTWKEMTMTERRDDESLKGNDVEGKRKRLKS